MTHGESPESARLPALIELDEFLTDIDVYIDEAADGRVFLLLRDGKPVCHLGPAPQ